VLLSLLRPLYAEGSQADEEDLHGVVAVLSLLKADGAEEQFKLLSKALQQIQSAGSARLKFLVPPLLFHALRLAQSFASAAASSPSSSSVPVTSDAAAAGDEAEDDPETKKARRVFKWANDAINTIREAGHIQLAFRL